MTWKNILKEEEEDLPEDVKRARERVRQGLPSKEMPLIPQFEDEKRMKKSKSNLPDEAKEIIEKVAKEMREAFEKIDHDAILRILDPTGRKPVMSKNELVDMLVENTIKRIKADRLYR